MLKKGKSKNLKKPKGGKKGESAHTDVKKKVMPKKKKGERGGTQNKKHPKRSVGSK